LRTWLVSILRRRIADRFRRDRPTEVFEEEKVSAYAEDAEDKLAAYEAASIAARAMDQLTDLERTAVTLVDVQDLERDEASERMGVTRGHLRVLLHRGRHKLGTALAAEGVTGPAGNRREAANDADVEVDRRWAGEQELKASA
jgi:RNA polymerase sigma factor (sigma-70 family)